VLCALGLCLVVPFKFRLNSVAVVEMQVIFFAVFRVKPLHYLGWLVGYEGKGSLAAYLKHR